MSQNQGPSDYTSLCILQAVRVPFIQFQGHASYRDKQSSGNIHAHSRLVSIVSSAFHRHIFTVKLHSDSSKLSSASLAKSHEGTMGDAPKEKIVKHDFTINKGIPFDPEINGINPLNDNEIKRLSPQLITRKRTGVTGSIRAAWLLKAVTCIDLTTLAGDDTEANVLRLCFKALNPVRSDILEQLNLNFDLTCGAVCVYPARVDDAAKVLGRAGSNLPIASVATGFPAGQTSLKVRLAEIRYAVEAGATEIDIVINRRHAINHDWDLVYDELRQMREACGEHVHMKAILAVGELPSFTEVYQASMVAMMAGSDFIKTSTGKEAVNATIPVGVVMCRAIRDFYDMTGIKIGLKPAGGIRTSTDAINWLILVKEYLGDEWLNPHLFRIGASGLLSDIERELYFYCFGRYPGPEDPLPLA